jgi:hypothetical protein
MACLSGHGHEERNEFRLMKFFRHTTWGSGIDCMEAA